MYPINILLVEHDDVFRHETRKLLEQSGFHVYVAEHPEQINDLRNVFFDWTFRNWRDNNIQPAEKIEKITLRFVEPNRLLPGIQGWPKLAFETR